MSDPRRIRLRRTAGWRKPEGAVVVARPSRWGNPYRVGSEGVPDRETAVRLYCEWIGGDSAEARLTRGEAQEQLRGRDLCCWCPLDGPCHADVLLEIANRES